MFRWGLLAVGLMVAGAHGQEVRLKPWEEAALNAVKAINSGNADLFLAWAHPAEQQRLKQKFMRELVTPTPGEPPIEEQLRPYGVYSVEDLARMPEPAFVAIAIPQQYAAQDKATKEAMDRATFRITKNVLAEEGVYEVHIALHVPFEVQPMDKDLVALAVKVGDGWKYAGLR